MRRSKKLILTLGVIATFITGSLLAMHLALAGDLEPSGVSSPTMHSLEEIYTLVENINNKVDSSTCEKSIEKTGQETSYATGDDGDLEKGAEWPSPRFTDNGDGTVTDKLTNLVWLKNANCFGTRPWETALTDSNTLATGTCGLTDGSVSGDWRLPNIKELQSLIDFGRSDPALPTGHPFTTVQSSYYWSSTTSTNGTNGAWYVGISYGSVNGYNKVGSQYVWPVRGGN